MPKTINGRINIDCPKTDTSVATAPSDISPGGKPVLLAKKLGIEDAMAASGNTPSKLILMHGVIRYNDLFSPETPIHHNDWCLAVLPHDIPKSVFSFLGVRDEAD
jgi:hypothetical protein